MFLKFTSLFSITQWILIASGVAFAAGGFSGYKFRGTIADAERGRLLAEHAEIVEDLDAERRELEGRFSTTSTDLEKKLALLRNQKPRTIVKWREYAKDPNYKCPVPASGVRRINDVVTKVKQTRDPR